jgi:signal transduction histidine kinase
MTEPSSAGRDLERCAHLLEERLLRIEHLVTSGQMAAEVSHQINNSLEGIKNYLYLLRQDLPQHEQHPSVRVIEEEVYRIAELSGQLARFHRQEPAGGSAVPASVRSVVERVLHLLSSRCRRLGVQVHWESFDESFATASVHELTQIFFSLILNALESMPSGGGLHLAAHRSEDGLRVVLRDEGTGIAPEDLERVFEPFFTRKSTSLGLGLSISKSLCEQMHARLRLQSEPGSGTQAELHLPREAEAPLPPSGSGRGRASAEL